jgi:nucleotide-binding universal stress UspA family protein
LEGDDIPFYQKRERTGMYEKILIAVDGSEVSMRAAEQGIQLAQLCKARVTVLSVLYSELTFTQSREEVLEEQKQESERVFREISERAEKAGVPFDTRLREGPPAVMIVDEASTGGYPLIVMGSRGKGALGSVAEKVVRTSHCPVLVVKA